MIHVASSDVRAHDAALAAGTLRRPALAHTHQADQMAHSAQPVDLPRNDHARHDHGKGDDGPAGGTDPAVAVRSVGTAR